jgi:hypothetical protein
VTDQPSPAVETPVPVIDAEPAVVKESRVSLLLRKAKEGVQGLIRKISEYPGTALLAAVILIALTAVLM